MGKELIMKTKPSYNEKKTTQAAAFLLELNGGKMNYMKLIKLLYNADREALRRWERPITFDDLYSLPHGQVVSKTLDRVRHGSDIIPVSIWKRHIKTEGMKAVLEKGIGVNELSEVEIDLLKELDGLYKDKDQFDMEKEHHEEFEEYIKTSSNVPTDYITLLRLFGKSEDEIQDLIAEFEELAMLEELA